MERAATTAAGMRIRLMTKLAPLKDRAEGCQKIAAKINQSGGAKAPGNEALWSLFGNPAFYRLRRG